MPGPNPVVLENQKVGTPQSVWDAASSNQIEGFAADFSYDIGNTVQFKINVNALPQDQVPYRLEIYRLGYYGGDGATLVTTINNVDGTVQPNPITDARGVVDAGNWSVTDNWSIPADAVSGVYLAKLQRLDGSGQPIAGATNQIPFIVRDDTPADGTKSDIVLQTSDTTWQAYNGWAGNNGQVGGDFYGGGVAHPAVADPGPFAQDRAYAVSYNRPFITRDGTSPASGAQDYLFGADYAAIYWLEKNGYDVSYISGVDTARDPTALLGHKAYISVGHDEYWSGGQRANVEAARDAGVNLLFWSGNEVYWKTRYEASIDGANTNFRTLVCYKETWANFNQAAGPADYANIDPSNEWTGTWRDLRFVGNPGATGQQPENSLTGQLFGPDGSGQFGGAIDIPAPFAGLRLWRDTGVAQTGQLNIAPGILGYEWDVVPNDQYRPAGLIKLSETTLAWNAIVTDQGNRESPGTATHNLSLYRDAQSGALVFGAGTVFWSWGLSDQHDSSPYGASVANSALQQFTVNLFADMGIQPGVADVFLASEGLVRATASTDTIAPQTTVGVTGGLTSVTAGQLVTITGTATDDNNTPSTLDDGKVAAVEVSTDGGATWRAATGTTSWTFSWTATGLGNHTILARPIDDSVNLQFNNSLLASTALTVNAAPPPTSFNLFASADGPLPGVVNDGAGIELGVKFQSSSTGTISQLEYFRGVADAGDTDVRDGHLWTADGTLLATVTFTSGLNASGWQIANLLTPVSILANTTYVVSYHSDNNYVATGNYFLSAHNGPDGYLTALASPGGALTSGGNGVYVYGASGILPFNSFNATNYWVDVTFVPLGGGPNTPPQITSGGTFAIAENGTAVSIVAATDSDLPAQALAYSILSVASGGAADAAKFAINSSTGALSFVAAPNFEAPTDAGGNNVYDVTVQVSDGAGGTAQQNIAVTVTNVAEAAPAANTFDGQQVRADYIFGTTVNTLYSGAGATQTASVGPGVEFITLPSAGPDVGNGPFGLAAADVGSSTIRIEFPVDPAFNVPVLDFAPQSSHPFNGVKVTDANGQVPDILGVSLVDQAGFTVPLNANNITFTSDSVFLNVSANGNNGRATDSDSLTAGNQASFVQLLVDFNDAPVITSNGGGATALVDVPANTTLVTALTATDADLGQTLSYSILPASGGGAEDSGLFEIVNGNELRFKTLPDLFNPPAAGANPGYQVTAEVSDGRGGFDTQDITVNVPNPAALLSGDYWTGIERTNTPVFVTYSFPTSAPASHAAVAGIDFSSFQAFNAAQQAAAVAALQQWANASGITILEVPPGQGEINVALYSFPGASGPGSGGMAFNPFGDWNYTTFTGQPNQAVFFSDTGDGVTDASGDVFINSAALVGGVIPTGLLLHEIGHALGLKHVNPTFVGDTSHIVFSGTVTHGETLDASLDNTTQTVMSYNGAAPTALGPLDVQAIQHIYGTNAQDGTQVASSSWNAGTFELTQTGFNGVDDIIRGVSVRDIMSGGTGNDRLFGLGGNDTLDGGAGSDQIWGGFGNDTLTGGTGADTFFITLFEDAAGQADIITDFNTAEDVIDLQLQGPTSFVGPASFQVAQDWLIRTTGAGNTGPGDAYLLAVWNGNLQTVTLNGVSADLSSGSLVSSLSAANFVTPSFGARTTTGTASDDMLFGSLSGDTLSGGGGADLLVGDAGNDILNGDAGTDLLDGGAGADTFNGGADQDAVYYMRRVDFALVGGVATAVGSTLAGDESIGDSFNSIEFIRGSRFNDTITLDASVYQAIGFGGDDVLTGSALANLLQGGDGNDTLIGGGGGDELLGGVGNDTLDASASTVQVHAWGGADNDTVTGSSAGDYLFGEAGTDTLNGGDGGDALNGGAGADQVNGEGGNDHFYDDDGGMSGDIYTGGSGVNVLHYSTGGTFNFTAVGADSYDTGVTWVQFDGGAVDATGRLGMINRFLGGTGNDTLTGGDQDDWLRGGDGNDTLYGGAGNDRLVGGAGNDIFEAGTGTDTYEGNAGADTFVFRDVSGFVNTPVVRDFSSADSDRIGLEAADFGPLGAGAFPADRFFTASDYWAAPPTITTTEEVVIYDTSNGFLYYDVNGSGAGGVTLAGILTGAPALAAADFLLI